MISVGLNCHRATNWDPGAVGVDTHISTSSAPCESALVGQRTHTAIVAL